MRVDMKVRIAILGSGTGSNAEAICAAANSADAMFEVALIMTTSMEAGICDVARRHAIACKWLEKGRDTAQQITSYIDQYHVDVLVLAGFMKLLPSAVIDHLNGNVLNVHPALLPKHGGKGMYGIHVHEAVLRSGDQVTGATVHLVTSQYDQGKIIAQRSIPVPAGATAEVLQQLVKDLEHQLYPQAIAVFIRKG